jgi:hypothetical protein
MVAGVNLGVVDLLVVLEDVGGIFMTGIPHRLVLFLLLGHLLLLFGRRLGLVVHGVSFVEVV